MAIKKIVSLFEIIGLFIVSSNCWAISFSCQQLNGSDYDRLIPAVTTQMIVVVPTYGFSARVFTCSKSASLWRQASFRSLFAVVGRSGVATIATKQEGDYKTPAGIYPLGVAFGKDPLRLNINYRRLTSADKFIDDPHSLEYNSWVNGLTTASSYEPLAKYYRLGIVINYNINPVVSGAGSAIFMHDQKSLDKPTSGCVAMEISDLQSILYWLDQRSNPYILILDPLPFSAEALNNLYGFIALNNLFKEI